MINPAGPVPHITAPHQLWKQSVCREIITLKPMEILPEQKQQRIPNIDFVLTLMYLTWQALGNLCRESTPTYL